MLLPSLISFLVRSLYISYYSYWVSVSFCFLFFVFSLIAASEGNLLIPYSVSFSLPSALGRYGIPFSFFLHFILRYSSYLFVFLFTESLLPFVFLCFSFCRHPTPSRPPWKKLMETHSFLIKIVLPEKKKKKLKGLITLNKLGRWARRLTVRNVSVNIAWQVRDKLPRVKTSRGNLRFLVASERDSFVAKTIITETFCSELFGVTQTFPIQFSSLAPQTV